MTHTPKYTLHKPTGQARVRIDGKDHYLGPHGSEASEQRYNELIARFLTSVRNPDSVNITLNRLCVAYIEHATTYYVKDGELTSELSAIRTALREVVTDCGRISAHEFKPKRLKAVRSRMVAKGWKRSSINKQVNRIVRMLAWGVENELVPPDIHLACKAVKSLARGRTAAVESKPVLPVPEDDIAGIHDFVPRQIWAMIQLQLETGMRPGEARTLCLRDLDRSNASSWEYLPSRHKTQHHGRDRRVYLNVRAQAIVTPFFKADPDACLFSPADAYQESQARRKKNRITPVTPSQAARTPVAVPRRSAGPVYTKDSYARCIRRACEVAGIDSWSPGRLRHNAGTMFEREFGEDVARAILGHSSKDTTRIYVEEDFQKARDAMERRA